MNAEQYRSLVAKLEAIQEDPATDASSLRAAQDNAGSQTGTSAPAPEPVQQTTGEQIPTIEAATFSQAYAKAKKMGLKKFKWCGIYAVKDKPVVNPQPTKNRPEYGGLPGMNPKGEMVPGTYYPDINAGGYTATYK